MNICEHLTQTARLFPEREAIVFEGRRYSYRELDQLSLRAAQHLVDLGVISGDRVMLMLANVPAFVVWYYAAARIGAIAATISSRFVDHEVTQVLKDSTPSVFVAQADTIAAVSDSLNSAAVHALKVEEDGQISEGASKIDDATESTWVELAPSDPAAILYTSGTTGVAKGVTLSQLNVRSNVSAFNHLCGMRTDDRILISVPLFHCFGQNALLNSGLNVGATLVLQRTYDPVDAKRLIAEHRVTKLFGVPTMFQLLHTRCEPEELASVKYCFSAAATLPLQVSENWQAKFGQPIYEGYGLTETSPFASYNHRLRHHPGSIGTAIDGVEMRIVDLQSGEPCLPGELGEIAIRGPNVMLGYWNRPEETTQSIKDGWFHSGDIGRIDGQGFFYLVDRLKDMISVGGLKVYPAEVENTLLDHPAVSQVAVVGKPDEVFGEKVVAFVVLDAAVPAAHDVSTELRRFAQTRLASYKVPQQVGFVDELPRNPSGKVLKTKLRDLDIGETDKHQEDQSEAPISATSTEAQTSGTSGLLEKLRNEYQVNRRQVATAYLQECVQTLSSADAAPAADARFLDVGLDSLMIVEMSSQLQAELGPAHTLPPTLLFDYPRICDLAEFLVELSGDAQKNVVESNGSVPTSVGPEVLSAGPSQLRNEVEALSEQEALHELIREIDTL